MLMTKQNLHDSRPALLALLVFKISRSCAVVFLALGLYVGLTNWEGDGSVWAFRYAGIALVIFLVGRGVYFLVVERNQ